jgi:CBS domain-containing protein
MKQLKSGYQDLLRLFQHSITVREIAEPLVSFEADIPSKKVLAFMQERDFDVVGVRRDGVTTHFVERKSLRKGFLEKHATPLSDNHLLDESAPLERAVEALKDSRWVFVRFLGRPSGIVTRGDLQKAPVRMWLFGLISLLEMQLTRGIKEAYPNDGWTGYLSPQRLKSPRFIQSEREQRSAAIDLVECVQIKDKTTIYRKSETLNALLPVMTNTKWKDFGDDLESLRNTLAHSNAIPSDSWPQIADLLKNIKLCFEKFEPSDK